MSIYTRTGDQGQTSLYSGERVDKDLLRVETYGALDELNSILGVARDSCRSHKVKEVLASLQSELFRAGSDLATTGKVRKVERIVEEDWRRQEKQIDLLQEELPPLKNFILPGGSSGGAFLHLARSVCRRVERLLVRLMKEEDEVNSELLIYCNRLSDLLFVLARYENVTQGSQEVIWRREV